MHELEYFKEHEFSCKCGNCGLGIESMDNRLLGILDAVRRSLGRPMRITSAVRCAEHNRAVGGSTNSEHVPSNTDSNKCTAVDVHIPDSNFLYLLIRELYAHDVQRIGWSQRNSFLHIGISEAEVHPQHVFFKY